MENRLKMNVLYVKLFIFSGKLDVRFEEYEAYLHLAREFELWQLKKLIELRLDKAKMFGKCYYKITCI